MDRSAMPPTLDADAPARDLMGRTWAHAYRWPSDAAGYAAAFVLDAEGHVWEGRVTVVARDRVDVADVADGSVVDWVKRTLFDQMMHLVDGGLDARGGQRQIAADRSPDGHPRGRRVFVNDGRMECAYRVLNERVTLVTRALNGRRRDECVESWLDLPDGRHLPQVHVTTQFAADGSVAGVQISSNQYVLVDDVWLPRTRTITSAESGAMRTRLLTLGGHRVLRIGAC